MNLTTNAWYSKAIISGCLLIFLIACNNVKDTHTPSTALSESEIALKAKEIHERSLVLDTHADIAMPTTAPLYLSADGKSKVDIEKLKSGGTNAVLMRWQFHLVRERLKEMRRVDWR